MVDDTTTAKGSSTGNCVTNQGKKYSGNTWTIYNTGNSGIPSDRINKITFDSTGNTWIGYIDGVAKFDGVSWTSYNIPSLVFDIAINQNNEIIIATANGICGSDGVLLYSFDVFQVSNLEDILIDKYNNIWVAGLGGIAMYNGIDCIYWTRANSPISSSYSYSLAMDQSGNLWIGNNSNGVNIFYNAEASHIPTGLFKTLHNNQNLFSIFPNPAIDHFDINMPDHLNFPVSIDIYNMQGKLVKQISTDENLLRIERKQFNAASGIYNVIFRDAQGKSGSQKIILND